jgi:predicted RNA-binding Zn-ribbon protein involved in translation (DUF1610 family)
MNPELNNERGPWESVHICPKCGLSVNLSQIDLRTITTGIVECSRCEWVGPVEIQIAEADGTAG